MKVYIYKPDSSGFQDDWLFAADMGFKQLGAEVNYFDNINNIPYAPDTVVVGYIEDTIKYFENNNIEYPKPLNIPDELNDALFLKRHAKVIKFKKAKTVTTSIFIKPHNKLKSFDAGVVSSGSKLNYLLELDDEELVFCSSVIDMKSEYRCFIYNGDFMNLKHYQGNPFIFPNVEKIQNMIKAYKSAPICYTLDVAINNVDETLLVECNDFWSVGNYGLEPKLYAKMLRDRWFQLTGYKK